MTPQSVIATATPRISHRSVPPSPPANPAETSSCDATPAARPQAAKSDDQVENGRTRYHAEHGKPVTLGLAQRRVQIR